MSKARLAEVFKTSERNKHSMLKELSSKLDSPLIVDHEPISSRLNQTDQPIKKRRANSKDPLLRIFKVNNKVYKFSKQMNEKVVRILDRYELDKPILMQDKLDMIWDKSKTDKMSTSLMETEGSLSRRQSLMAQSHNHIVKRNLRARKVERERINKEQVRVY